VHFQDHDITTGQTASSLQLISINIIRFFTIFDILPRFLCPQQTTPSQNQTGLLCLGYILIFAMNIAALYHSQLVKIKVTPD